MAASRFGYYARLSAGDKRIYRKSDAVGSIDLPRPGELRPIVRALEAALEAGKRVGVGKNAQALSNALCRQLGVPPARVRVREVRPEFDGGELHGLYTFAEGKEAPQIEVWMRTVAHRRVVRFKTFLRTLLHEIVHHLDVVLLGLTESFHTEGFFRRESALMRELLGTGAAAAEAGAPRGRGSATDGPGDPASDGDLRTRKGAAAEPSNPATTDAEGTARGDPQDRRTRKDRAATRGKQLRLFD